MSQSSGSRPSRKAPDKPKKPYPDFPLTPHASGAWMKKIRGRIYYFGKWGRRIDGKLTRVEDDGWKEALDKYKKVADDLHAGRTPREQNDGLTVGDLCNRFLTAKTRKMDAGEMSVRNFRDYKNVTDVLVKSTGSNRRVDDLNAEDFAELRAAMVKLWGPVRLANSITRVKSIFKFGYETGLMEKPVRYGPEFVKPDKAVLRRHRTTMPARMFEAVELRALIDGALVVGKSGPELVRADPTLRAMILLGVNCGFGNTDCAEMKFTNLDLVSGWLNCPRVKTGIERRCPLWPETVTAIQAATAEGVRPEPNGSEEVDRVFLTTRGNAYIKANQHGVKDQIAIQFSKFVKTLGIYREGVGFYALRHSFRTVADESKDQVAVDLIMGHTDPSMAGHYRERIDDERLRAVSEYVRKWLFKECVDSR